MCCMHVCTVVQAWARVFGLSVDDNTLVMVLDLEGTHCRLVWVSTLQVDGVVCLHWQQSKRKSTFCTCFVSENKETILCSIERRAALVRSVALRSVKQACP
jgi:hexokinase